MSETLSMKFIKAITGAASDALGNLKAFRPWQGAANRYAKAAIFLLLTAVGASAQADCASDWDAFRMVATIVDFTSLEAETVEVTPQGCVARRISADMVSASSNALGHMTLRAAEMSWNIEGADRLAAMLPPEKVDLHLSGAYMFMDISQYPSMSYAAQLVSARNAVDLWLEVSAPPATGDIVLTRLAMEGPNRNDFTLSGRITDMDLTSHSSIQNSIMSAALKELNLTIETHGMFEAYGVHIIAGLWSSQGVTDVQHKVERLKAFAQSMIASVPETLLSAASGAALSDMIDVMPAPDGILSLDLHAPEGLSATRFASLAFIRRQVTPEVIWSILEGVTVTAEWEETPDPR